MPNAERTTKSNNRAAYFVWIAGLSVLVTMVWVYTPGLSGGFQFDDIPNIVQNPKVQIGELDWRRLRQAAWSSDAGPLGRPLSMLSFALNHYWGGLDPYWFKWTNLVIHLLNGLGIFFLSRLLFSAGASPPAEQRRHADWAALAVCAAWLLHPFNLTSVLYVVQRMTELAAFFVIWGMVLYVWGRQRQIQGRRGGAPIALALLACAPLAALGKENGLLFFPFLCLVEWVFFGFRSNTKIGKIALYGLYSVTVAIPALGVAAILLFHPEWLLSEYKDLGFDLRQRLYTEARVLWFYARMVLLPDITRMGLYHDDITISTGLWRPATTGIALAGLGLAVAAALALKRSRPLVSFGVLFFLAGHGMESTFIPLELVHEHRNYLPAFGLLFALFGLLLQPTRVAGARGAKLKAVTAVLLIAVYATSTAVRARTWSNPLDLALTSVRHHPDSLRANLDAGKVFVAGGSASPDNRAEYYRQARRYFDKAVRSAGPDLTGELSLLVLDDREGRPVDAARLARLARRLVAPPLAVSSVNALLTIGRCQHQGVCRFPPEVFATLYPAILENPSLTPRYRSQVLAEALQYAIDRGDLKAAAVFAGQAVEAYPADPQLHLNYAHLLMLLGDRATAARHVELAERYDTDRFYADKIESWKSALSPAPQ